MSASEARILANQQNALRSTGPKTSEGKAVSRGNSYKHGLTGDGVVVSNADAVKIEQRTRELTTEFRPTTSAGRVLVERMAVLSVRMDRSVAQETAAISGRVRQVMADFEAPEGLDEATVAKLRREAGDIALFDPSKEATLARKYEAAAERGFFRALKELRLVEKPEKRFETLPEVVATKTALGSFLPVNALESILKTLPAVAPKIPASVAASPSPNTVAGGARPVPMTIGRAG